MIFRLKMHNMNITEKISILLVDDHRVMSQGLRLLFRREPCIEVVNGECHGTDAAQLVREHEPNVAIIDVNRPDTDNIELSRELLSEKPDIKIVLLPTQLHAHVLEQAIRYGVMGFILKECNFAELLNAVKSVHRGNIYMCSKIKDILANGYLDRAQAASMGNSSALTEREYEIIRYMSLGRSSKEIAGKLNISSKTVDACRRKIMTKLEIDSVAELVKYAIRSGITSI
ncbi:MAG: response regulator transcription factor [Sedimentisphaerales bacterium]|nr:response regulator transcription factor [Sedimentisphaerales bacterium]